MEKAPTIEPLARVPASLKVLALVRAAVALVVVMALVAQIEDQMVQGTFVAATYFSYFSIQTSIANALGLGLLALATFFLPRQPRAFTAMLGTLVAYAIMTAGVYNLLLRDSASEPDATPLLSWPIEVTHVWVPLYLILEWILNPHQHRLRWSFVLLGLGYPLAWITFTLSRGGLTGWYPYDFFDPASPEGWAGVSVYILVIGAVCAIVLFVLTLINRTKRLSPSF